MVQTRSRLGRQACRTAAAGSAERSGHRARRARVRPAQKRERERGPVASVGQGREGQGLRDHVTDDGSFVRRASTVCLG